MFHVTANITEVERPSEIPKTSCPEVPMSFYGFSDIGMWHSCRLRCDYQPEDVKAVSSLASEQNHHDPKSCVNRRVQFLKKKLSQVTHTATESHPPQELLIVGQS